MGLGPGNGLPPTDPPIGLFDGIIAAIFNALQWVLNLLIAIANFIWQVLISIVKALITIFQAGFKFLKHIWTNYIVKGVNWLASHIQKLRDWLKRTLGPVIKWFQRIKKWYDTHILPQQLRMLKMLQTIRRFLGILRLFHIKWAAKLDNVIVDLENRIQKSIALVRGTLNQIINTLAIVLDPTLLIFRNVLGGSLLKNLGAIKRIFAFFYHGPLTTRETTLLDNNVGRYQEKTANSHIATLASTGLTDYDLSELADVRAGISDVTGVPPAL
jgi:hypothetical protein